MSAARKYHLKRKNIGKFMKQNEEHSLVLKLELRCVKRSRSDKCESGNGMGAEQHEGQDRSEPRR